MTHGSTTPGSRAAARPSPGSISPLRPRRWVASNASVTGSLSSPDSRTPASASFCASTERELIIGDRATGKTAIGVDTIINQKHTDVVCVYVAIGQRATAVRRVIEAVQQHGAPERCVFVVASAAASPGLQWIAPFAGFTIAEYFRDHGQHALVIVDDLTKHAATHRELALLTREPPGREAYPGDIFYLHSRLLERSAKLSAELGGGSLTGLPIP